MPVEYEKYCNYILLRKPGEIGFEETVHILMKIFSEKCSLFHAHWRQMNLTKKEDEVTYTGSIKKNSKFI